MHRGTCTNCVSDLTNVRKFTSNHLQRRFPLQEFSVKFQETLKAASMQAHEEPATNNSMSFDKPLLSVKFNIRQDQSKQ